MLIHYYTGSPEDFTPHRSLKNEAQSVSSNVEVHLCCILDLHLHGWGSIIFGSWVTSVAFGFLGNAFVVGLLGCLVGCLGPGFGRKTSIVKHIYKKKTVGKKIMKNSLERLTLASSFDPLIRVESCPAPSHLSLGGVIKKTWQIS